MVTSSLNNGLKFNSSHTGDIRLLAQDMAGFRRICLSRKRLCLFVLILSLVGGVYFAKFSKTGSSISIVVVEEHHEVLPYWFDAAKRGEIKKTGNTLIHFDGHSDDAPPEYFGGYPLFHWPRNDQELSSMMQRNDVFIVAAIMTGLVNRFIWIWPPWDNAEHEMDHIRLRGYIGLAVVQGPEGEEKVFCDCKQMEDQKEIECQFVNYSSSGADVSVSITHHQCKPGAEYTAEFVKEEVAMKLLKGNKLVKKNESFILDVDEDYYGCESGTEVLFDTGIDFKSLQLLNLVVGRLLCPRNAYQEKLGDKLMFELINLFLKKCEWNSAAVCTRDDSFLRRSTEKYVLRVWLKYPSLFCARNNVALMKLYRNVSHSLHSFKKTQLLALRHTGFCMSMSAKTLLFTEEPSSFRVCHGFNIPGDTVVTLHSPHPVEVNLRSANLREMMTLLGRFGSPGIVSISRSFRDGFIPKRFFRQIEDAVLGAVKLTGRSFVTHYDEELLGGAKGWPSRHG